MLNDIKDIKDAKFFSIDKPFEKFIKEEVFKNAQEFTNKNGIIPKVLKPFYSSKTKFLINN